MTDLRISSTFSEAKESNPCSGGPCWESLSQPSGKAGAQGGRGKRGFLPGDPSGPPPSLLRFPRNCSCNAPPAIPLPRSPFLRPPGHYGRGTLVPPTGPPPKSWAAAPRVLEGSPVALGTGFPCCLRLASPRMSMTSVANSWALKRASFCLPWRHRGGQPFRGLQGRPGHAGRLLLPTQGGAVFCRDSGLSKLAPSGSRLILPLPPF